jgi:anti-sigma-K factor RskA
MNYEYYDIELYLNGELNAEDKNAFEQQLQTDEALQQKIRDYQQLQATIQKHTAAEETLPQLKAILEPLTKQHFAAKQQQAKVFTLKRMSYVLAAAASIALIFFLALPGISPDGYRVEDMPGAVVRGNEDAKAKAAQLFNAKQYEEAAAALQQLKQTSPADAAVDFYLGISLLKTEKYNEALALFETLAAGTSVYKEDAVFFAALSAFHLQQTEKAKQYAEQVKETSRYEKETRTLLKKLK